MHIQNKKMEAILGMYSMIWAVRPLGAAVMHAVHAWFVRNCPRFAQCNSRACLNAMKCYYNEIDSLGSLRPLYPLSDAVSCENCQRVSTEAECQKQPACSAVNMCYAQICTGPHGTKILKGCDHVDCSGRANGDMWCNRNCRHCYVCCDGGSYCNRNTTSDLVSLQGKRETYLNYIS